MTTLQDKLDNIYQTKLEIKNALGTDSDVFSEYPDMIRSMAGGGVSYSYLDERLSYYVELTDLESMSYATESYVMDAIGNIPIIDTSSYITYTYLESKEYATESYVTNAISNIPVVDTSSYVTYSYLDSCGYITSNDLPVINENIIPKENNTYTLGDIDHLYNSAYATDLYMSTKNKISNRSDNQINIMLNNGWKYTFHSNGITPVANQNQNLGASANPWYATYTSYLYATYIGQNTYVSSYQAMYFGTDRPWCLYGSGGGSNEETIFTNRSSAGKWFRIKDYYGNNILSIYQINSVGNKIEIPATTYASNLYANTAYISNSTYLPVNTYWYDGSAYHWLGELFN